MYDLCTYTLPLSKLFFWICEFCYYYQSNFSIYFIIHSFIYCTVRLCWTYECMYFFFFSILLLLFLYQFFTPTIVSNELLYSDAVLRFVSICQENPNQFANVGEFGRDVGEAHTHWWGNGDWIYSKIPRRIDAVFYIHSPRYVEPTHERMSFGAFSLKK